MKSVYIYPTYRPDKDATGNKYIEYFHDAFRRRFYVRELLSQFGIISLFFNIKSDLFIFHRVETIRFKRFGLVQVFVFVVGVSLLKIFEKKIIWVLHNKKPHRENSCIALFCMRYIAHRADLIITHSKEGISFAGVTYGAKTVEKVKYIPHPVYSNELLQCGDIDWDIVIWGTVEKYKNILEFVEFVNFHQDFLKKRILICGRCPDPEYANRIVSVLPHNVTFKNEFIEDSQLREYLLRSRVILFTYKLDSVLSSGALVYSLNFNKKIVGPRGGAFKDLHPIVECYDSFNDLLAINFDGVPCTAHIKKYLEENSWDALPLKVLTLGHTNHP